MCDFRVDLSPEECRALFDKFDLDQNGEVSYDELMLAVAGDMNPLRKDFVTKAFKKIDRDGSGILDMKDIR